LDLRVTYYIYNNKLRFTNFKLVIKDNKLYINKSIILIKGFSTFLLLFYINVALLQLLINREFIKI
jgi:hypothetical protein